MRNVKAKSISIESKTEQLVVVREFVSHAAREFGFSDEEVSKIALAVDEACTNVIKHAYKFDPGKQIIVNVKSNNGAFEISITDDGKRFNPDKLQAPDMKEYLSHYRKGGLGVYLMKSLMDEVEYSVTPGERNEVRLTKHLNRSKRMA